MSETLTDRERFLLNTIHGYHYVEAHRIGLMPPPYWDCRQCDRLLEMLEETFSERRLGARDG